MRSSADAGGARTGQAALEIAASLARFTSGRSLEGPGDHGPSGASTAVADGAATNISKFSAGSRESAARHGQPARTAQALGCGNRPAQESKIEQLKTQIKDQKAILSAAKKACRKGGRCFHCPDRAERAPAIRRENRARDSPAPAQSRNFARAESLPVDRRKQPVVAAPKPAGRPLCGVDQRA